MPKIQKWIRTRLRRLTPIAITLSLLLGGTTVLSVAVGVPAAHAAGTYNNATIATNALADLGQDPAPGGGQCKAFANAMVNAASGGTQSPSGYQSGWAAAGGTLVSSANAAEGDIIQITPAGSTDSTAESIYSAHLSDVGGNAAYKLHTTIIVGNNGNNSFTVVDANFTAPYTVGEHYNFNPYTWAAGSIINIWRMGTSTSSLADGTFFEDSGSTTVYEMVGGAALFVPSWASVGGVHSVITISPTYYPSVPASGTFVEDYGSPSVYEMFGGAALAVPSWASVGGAQSPVVIPSGTSFPTVPASGIYFEDYGSTTVNEIVGGAQLWVPNWSSVGGQQPYTVIPSGASFPTTPANGTFIENFGYSTVYEIAGGAAFPLSAWSQVGGSQPLTIIPATAFPQYPANGTYVEEYGGTTVYTIAGGAPVPVTAWSDVGGSQPVAQVPGGAISSGQLRQYPADGTFVIGYGQSTVYEMAGGGALAVSAWSAVGGTQPVTTIDNNGFSTFHSYPANGTYVKGYGSGEEFLSNGSTVTRVTTSPLPPAITVDDWAIIHQLGGTE